jgi:signal transduction histidine kinase
MTGLRKRSVLAVSAIVVVAGVVLVLAVLQYRWTDQVAVAERERMRAALNAGIRQLRHEFTRELQVMCASLVTNPGEPASGVEAKIVRQSAEWAAHDSHPALLADVFLWRIAPAGAPVLLRLDQKAGQFDATAWTPALSELREGAESHLSDFRQVSERQVYMYPWFLHEDSLMLSRPVFDVTRKGGPAGGIATPVGFVVAAISRQCLEKELLPALAERYFGAHAGAGPQITVRSMQPPYAPVYQSTQQIREFTAPPDAVGNMFDVFDDREAPRRGPMVWPGSEQRQWQVVVWHPAGSLEVAITRLRIRYLATSFGLLFALAAATALIVVLSRRAQRLAQLQMEFVAGVSHDLCTPLAVICSAAENLADGVTDNPRRVREYGCMIRDEGRRLVRMVDEVLSFAAGGSGKVEYEIQPVDVGAAIEHAVAAAAPMFKGGGFVVETAVEEGTPPVMADPAALGQCLENLLCNACKHGAPHGRIAVWARPGASRRGAEVDIGVEDDGIGIPAADLPHIFEPFYRARPARDNQVRGVGLGLHLVNSMMSAMGGRTGASSRLGKGSLFTLSLPAAPLSEFPFGKSV